MSLLGAILYETTWFHAGAIIVAAIIIARIANFLFSRRQHRSRDLLGRAVDEGTRTRYAMVKRLTQAAIIFTGIALALSVFPEIDTLANAMLTSVAIVGVVIGIAARAPLANFVSGVMIAFSQPVRLGDYICIGDAYGVVEDISLTYTTVRTADDHRVIIPNETFASTAIRNFSKGTPDSMVKVAFAVPLERDLEVVRRDVLALADQLAPAPDYMPNYVEVESLDGQQATLGLHAWSADPHARSRLASDLRAAIADRLRAELIVADESDGAPPAATGGDPDEQHRL